MWITTEQLGSYENGTWTGALGMVLDGTLDTIAVPHQRTDLREQFFEFSSSFYDVKLAYLAKETKKSGLETIFDIFSPFSPNVWLTYLATILALVITLLFIDAGYSKATKQPRMKSSSGFVAWNFFRILIRSCGQDGPLKWAPYLFRKNSPFIERFNTALYSTQRLTDRIWAVYFGEGARQKKTYYCKQPITLSPLSLETYLGIFALILIGYVLAATLFIAETVRRKWTHQKIEHIDDNLNEKLSRWRLNRKRTVSHSAVRIDTTADRLASRPSPLVISNVRGLQPDMFISDFAGNGHSYSTA
uniref:Uncharacterized protein n=1 Tax=Plectus sambesii TaxID=2011161 RepID=A0A914XHH5_9BILA